MTIRMPFGLDPFLPAMALCVVAASLFPCRGDGAEMFGWITTAAITLLFFLHGARLSRAAVWAGIGHWRLHLLVLASTYLLFPAIGVLFGLAGRSVLDATTVSGVMFLCILPSTVQSSIAFTSIARGNVPAAVCSATLSNLIGIVLTPVLVGVFMSGLARGTGNGIDLGAMEAIALHLLLPFVLGHVSRPLTARFMESHRAWIGRVDRSSILLVVYTAFSAAVMNGLWSRLSALDLGMILAIDGVLLAAVLIVTTMAARLAGFSREDEITTVFCGSKKSLASGVPMAGVLFAPAVGGPLILPLMIFHQMQLTVCAILARRYATRLDARPADRPPTMLHDDSPHPSTASSKG